MAGGVTPGAVVMVWHEEPEVEPAALRANDVVMTPDPTLLLRRLPGQPAATSRSRSAALTTAAHGVRLPPPAGAHVLGVQGNLWTEFIPTRRAALVHGLPARAGAGGNRLDAAARGANGGDFALRLGPALARLEREGVPFRIPAPAFRAGGAALDLPDQQFVRNHTAVAVAGDGVDVGLSETVPDATIRYTLDGTLPSAASPPYAAPLHVALAPGGHATVAAIAVLPDGRRSAPAFLDLSRPVRS